MKRSRFLFGAISLLSLVIVYSIVTTGIGCTFAGLLDHVSLILIFLLGNEMLRSVPGGWARPIGSAVMIAILALFFFMNTLHFRFFHTWGEVGAIKQWEDIRSIWSGLKVLAKPADLIFFFICPLAAWGMALFSGKPRMSKTGIFLLIFIFGITHAVLASPEISYNENDPLIATFREKVKDWLKPSNPKKPVTFGAANGQYQAINSSLYENAGRPDYPLMKIPLPNSRALPFQLDKPNVVLILMESVRAYESGAYGAAPSFTPAIDRLAKEGFLFKNFYANSYQTVRGEYAIHSSFVPTVQGNPEYVDRPHLSLLTWPSLLKRHGYATMWIGSYKPTFDNKQDFLSHHGIDSFLWDIPKGYRKVGWGPSDEDLFNYAFGVLSEKRSPYFAEIMTLSNHFPWDDGSPTAALAPAAKGSDMYKKYAQGIFYTDYAIGKFFDRIRSDSRFDNTLFIICGDHGIWLYPDNVQLSPTFRQEIYFRVPLVMWSRRLQPRVIDTLGSQVDIGPTVLDLLGLRDTNYAMGTSLLRQDVPERFVLMSQDGRWNMRRGNVYTYDVGPEIFKEHYPFNEAEYQRLIKNKHMAHVDFSTDEDLLTANKTALIKILSDPKQTDQLHQFAEDAFAFYHGLMLMDKITPKEEQPPLSEKK